MAVDEEKGGRRAPQVFRFVGGLAVGLMAVPMSVALLVLAVILLFRGAEDSVNPYAAFDLQFVGQDISRAGGTSLVVHRSGDRLHQRCRDICDDVAMKEIVGRQLDRLEVLGPNQVCILCRDDIGAGSQTWLVEGERRLSLVRGPEQ